jgi:hypothetical protein
MITKHEAIVSIAQTLLRSSGKPIDRDAIAVAAARAFNVVVDAAHYNGADRYETKAAADELERRYMIAPSDRGSRDDMGGGFNQDFRSWHDAGAVS